MRFDLKGKLFIEAKMYRKRTNFRNPDVKLHPETYVMKCVTNKIFHLVITFLLFDLSFIYIRTSSFYSTFKVS